MNILPVYRVLARNTATDSENTIHADEAARQFGFRGGLVPGVVVFGYAIQPAIEFFGAAWLESGKAQIKLQQPAYDGDELVIRAHSEPGFPGRLMIVAGREAEMPCATAEASLADEVERLKPPLDNFPERPLPDHNQRPLAGAGVLTPGTVLGTVRRRLDSKQSRVFEALDKSNAIFFGGDALSHPAVLLELANQALLQNFRIGPWLHASSTIINWSAAHDGEAVEVRSRVSDCFERKGHEFVVIDLVIVGESRRLIQHVIHTAIYRPKFVSGGPTGT